MSLLIGIAIRVPIHSQSGCFALLVKSRYQGCAGPGMQPCPGSTPHTTGTNAAAGNRVKAAKPPLDLWFNSCC